MIWVFRVSDKVRLDLTAWLQMLNVTILPEASLDILSKKRKNADQTGCAKMKDEKKKQAHIRVNIV